jgi:nickel-dependent lactate racemase
MRVKYGTSFLKVEVPKEDLIGVLSGKHMPPLSDPRAEILASLRKPIGTKPLKEIVNKGEKVAIVVSDRTRSTKADVFLPVMIDELDSAGIPNEDISIVFSIGAHLKHTREQQERIVGKEIAARIPLFDHDCRDEDALVDFGKTSRGTPVKFNKRVAEADRKILTAGITYHYFAGFGGGRKAALPGVAGFETIQANHQMSMREEVCKTAALEGNPLSEDMEEAARMLQPDFILNTVLNEERELCGVFAGDLIAAHRAGCRFINQSAMVKIKEKADLVVAAAGGGGMDLNYVQSHKAMENACYALKDGGVMILLAESSEGFPSEIYLKYIELGSTEKIRAALVENFTIPGHTVYATFCKAEKFKIIWVSKLPKAVVRKMGITPADSFDEAYALAGDWLKTDRRAYIMPLAYSTFPVLI